jgi:hypothetical protein
MVILTLCMAPLTPNTVKDFIPKKTSYFHGAGTMTRMALIVRLYSSVWFAWTMVESTCIMIKFVLEHVTQGSCMKTLGYLSQERLCEKYVGMKT